MPTTKRKSKRGRSEGLTLDTLGIMEILAFGVAWSPPVDLTDLLRFPRWKTWEAYFKDFDLIRPLLIVSDYHKPGSVLFADQARQEMTAHPDQVWQKHTHKALLHSHLYAVGDGHIHDDDVRLGAAVECEVSA